MISIQNVNIQEFRKYLSSFKSYEYFIDFWKGLSDKEISQKNVKTLHQDNEIIGWFTVNDFYGTPWIRIIYIARAQIPAIQTISQIYPNSIFEGEYTLMKNAGLTYCNNKCDDGYYNYRNCYTNGDQNILKNAFEKQFLWQPEDSVVDLEFIDMSTEEISKATHSHIDSLVYTPCCNTNNGHPVFPGFHYFWGGDDFSYYDRNQKVRFLLARSKNTGKIAGVIRYGEWPYTPGITSIAYVDVTTNARKKGVARLLARELNKVLDHSKPLALGNMSEMGKACHIDEVFKEEITNIQYT